MLTTRWISRLGVTLGVLVSASTVSPALAAPPVDTDGYLCRDVRFCVEAESQPKLGSGASEKDRPSGSGAQRKPEKLDCAPVRLSPQPEADSPLWGGRPPEDGAIYQRACTGGDFNAGGTFFAEEPPEEDAPDPAELAEQAIDSMTLAGPRIASPDGDGRYLVGMPMWMWVTPSATTYGPNTATASAGGVTVTATAEVSQVVWSMGDGNTVTCTKPGTPYRKTFGKKKSPDCGHVYTEPSSKQRGDAYTVTATSTWVIEWEGGGQSGELTTTRTSEVSTSVSEAQVVN